LYNSHKYPRVNILRWIYFKIISEIPIHHELATAGLTTADFRYRRSNFWEKISEKREICNIFLKFFTKTPICNEIKKKRLTTFSLASKIMFVCGGDTQINWCSEVQYILILCQNYYIKLLRKIASLLGLVFPRWFFVP